MKPLIAVLTGLILVPAQATAQTPRDTEIRPAAADANPPRSLAPSPLQVGTTPPDARNAPSEERAREREARQFHFRYLPLLTAGAGMFTLFYAPAAVGASICVRGDALCGPYAAWLYLPLLGPFLAASDGSVSAANTLWMVDGFCQIIGFTAMMIGLRRDERHWITVRLTQIQRHRAFEISRWAATPMVSPNFAGMSLVVENF